MPKYQIKAFWTKRAHNNTAIIPMLRASFPFHINAMADGEPAPVGTPPPPPPAAGYVPESLLKEAFAARDEAKAAREATEKKMSDMSTSLDALKSIIGDDPEKFKTELAGLRDFQKTAEDKNKSDIEKLQAALTDATNNHKAAIEKMTDDHGKAAAAAAEAVAAKDAVIAELRGYVLKSEIYKAAVMNNAANPDQIVLMLSGSFALTDKGDYVHKGKTAQGTPVDQSIAEYCKEFLEDEANANLLGGSEPRRATTTPNKVPGSPGDGINKGSKGGKAKGDGPDGKTYLELLGRALTENDRRRFVGMEDESIAMQLYHENKAMTAQRARDEELAKSGRLPGETVY